MYNRISDSSTRATQTDELSQPGDNDSFTETLANLAMQRSLPPDKMGCCVSTPRASDPDNPSASSAARPSTSLFEYRTAELADANVDGICVGLTGEWLNNLGSSPRSRMNALIPGSERHRAAAERQQQYEDLRAELRRDGAESSQANMQAKNTVLREMGLEPSGREKEYNFDPASSLRMQGKITADGSNHLLSLRFAEGGRHTIATSASDGRTTLFDPNYGEFSVRPDQMDRLFQSLDNRYRNPNGLHISTITTQKM
ncbi:YopT-type cysteine protease domain-containing protein [Bradyrhizobium erythrophlei]|uniref:YopT-type cysteine protease domain-containing protein n=1 Tax=Bradyrhizobium erythrophlei TaxID=1437360 RepID=UPI0035E6EE28